MTGVIWQGGPASGELRRSVDGARAVTGRLARVARRWAMRLGAGAVGKSLKDFPRNGAAPWVRARAVTGPLARAARIRCQRHDGEVSESAFFGVTSQADSDGYLTVSRRNG